MRMFLKGNELIELIDNAHFHEHFEELSYTVLLLVIAPGNFAIYM